MAIRHGASALGLVSAMPSGPGVVADEIIAEVARTVPPSVASFLLTSRQDVAGIVEQQRRLRATTLQIVDRLTTGTHRDLRACPARHRPRAGRPRHRPRVGRRGPGRGPRGRRPPPRLGQPGPGREGARRHRPPSRLAPEPRDPRARRGAPVPGRRASSPENVAEAIAEVGPFGLDLCSGVRTGGALDERKLERFFAAVAAA